MMYKVLVILFLLFSLATKAQSKLDFATVDQKTYAFYQAAQWDSLIYLGKQAQKQNISYYYLNYRMGVAYFYNNNFYQANTYFQAALEQNNEAIKDAFFTELYHLSLVYAQRNDLAMDIPLPENSKVEDPMMRNQLALYVGGGKMTAYDHAKGKYEPNSYYSEVVYQDAVNYWGLSFGHQFNSRFNLTFSYSNLHFLMNTLITDLQNDIAEDYKITQYNIALIPEFSLGTKWQIRPVFGYTSNKGFPFSIVDTINNTKVYDYWSYKENNYMVGANIYRHIQNVKLGLNFGISNYSQRRQAQAGLNLTYFPFGNLNLYSFSELSLKVDDGQKDLIIHQEFGFKTFSALWVELGGEFGELKNYNEYSLGYGYNIADNMDMRLYGRLIFVLSNHVNLTIGGQYVHKYTYRKDDYYTKPRTETRIDYDQWNIEGGLIWKI